MIKSMDYGNGDIDIKIIIVDRVTYKAPGIKWAQNPG